MGSREGAQRYPPTREELAEGRHAPTRDSVLVARLPGYAVQSWPLYRLTPRRCVWQQGSIEVQASDREHALPRFCVLVDGAAAAGVEGKARLRGLRAGAHEIVVCVAGRKARRTTVILAEGQALVLSVVL